MRKAIVMPALIAALIVGLVSAPAAAQEYVPVLDPSRVYFQCGANRVANSGDPATWSTQEPNAPTPFGGCAQWDFGGRYDTLPTGDRQDATFVGTYTGNLDTLTLHAYVVWTGAARVCLCSSKTVPIGVDLTIDGAPILGPNGRIVNVMRSGSATVVDAVQITVTDIALLGETDAGTHTIELSLDAAPLNAAVWRYGASDLPAGIEFNPGSHAATTVARTG